VLPANAFSTITSPWDWCRGRDAMMESAAVRFAAIYCDSFWNSVFNETRVTPVSLIEQFLYQQRVLRAHETSFLPGL
jgi:hypothetical protein